ncbi:hypothetical protein C8J55DRAFT_503735 [Lentinula edodes]|uniref:Uncharacterized protein n=1 Tax=Lentinula lateritia TaxID=40482 RepID=A0A9W9AX59_9AGAR|nr:hypothetical protein C8J55DRAFT_503735 [Lentinula edodes]
MYKGSWYSCIFVFNHASSFLKLSNRNSHSSPMRSRHLSQNSNASLGSATPSCGSGIGLALVTDASTKVQTKAN